MNEYNRITEKNWHDCKFKVRNVTDTRKILYRLWELENMIVSDKLTFSKNDSSKNELVTKINKLSEENTHLYEYKLRLEGELIEHGWAEYVDNKLITMSDAIDDTKNKVANEIYDLCCSHGTTYIKKYLKEKYGLEKETK